MRLRHIELIQAILATGSLTQAAAALHISQPAASKMLAHAEAQLGFKLFERVKGRLRATREADILTPEIDRLTVGLDGIRRLAINLRHHPSGHLRVGCAPGLGLGLLPHAIRISRDRHPGITFAVHTHHTSELIDKLQLREIDIALTFEPPVAPGIASVPLGHSQLVVLDALPTSAASPKASPTATAATDNNNNNNNNNNEAGIGSGTVSLSDIPPDALIALDMHDPLGGKVHRALVGPAVPDIDTPPSSAASLQVQTHYVACALADAGCGVAIVDAYTAHAMRRAHTRIRRITPEIGFRVDALLLASDAPSALVRGFIVCLRTACAQAPDSTGALDAVDTMAASDSDFPGSSP